MQLFQFNLDKRLNLIVDNYIQLYIALCFLENAYFFVIFATFNSIL